jgi:hypothetical protein
MTILPNETIRLSRRGNRFANDLPGAFSSEVETGSRQENASNQESRAPFRFYRNGKALAGLGMMFASIADANVLALER